MYISIMHVYHIPMLRTSIMYFCQVLVSCTRIMYLYPVSKSCTYIMYLYYAPLSCISKCIYISWIYGMYSWIVHSTYYQSRLQLGAGDGFEIEIAYYTLYVECIVCNISTIKYTLQCTVYIVECTMYIVHCTMYSVHCTLYSIHCKVCNIISHDNCICICLYAYVSAIRLNV